MAKKDFIVDLDDMGFSFADDMTEETKNAKQNADDIQARLDKLYNTMTAFLSNMSKNPEKETLVWPNRVEKINEFQIMLKKIKEGEI